ncbi:hypothetical protein CYFUS_005708 [Cystobacter fuscus]|uniref:Uncharacterized protein n=1 Tax=Cystobacter fuscus TaxID=43 RepID=A0A250J9M6_9BACT|nr:hypothetical protein CYFUS_005708 [Cystobacter fuscus]
MIILELVKMPGRVVELSPPGAGRPSREVHAPIA